MFIYINNWVLKYKSTLEKRKKQELILLIVSKKQEIKIENANFESTSTLMKAIAELKVK